jgi:hypothetical protein
MKNQIEFRGGKPLRDFCAAILLLAVVLQPALSPAGADAKTTGPPSPVTPYSIPGLIALDPSDPIGEEFLGLSVGMSMAEVRARLRTLNATDVAEETIAEGKTKSGTKKLTDREYDKGGIRKRGWKLPDTPFEWVTVTSNRRGIVILITAAYRAGQAKSFSEIANLDKAVFKSDSSVTWNVLRPTGNFLIVANGGQGKATTLSMKLAEVNPIFVPATAAPDKTDS